MTDLDKSLSDIIAEIGETPGFVTFLKAQGITTCADYYDCVKNADEIETKVAAKLTPPTEKLADISKLRQIWRRRKVVAEAALGSDNLCPEDWEVPLPQPTKPSLLAKAQATYNVMDRAWKMPCDSLLGRIFREREEIIHHSVSTDKSAECSNTADN